MYPKKIDFPVKEQFMYRNNYPDIFTTGPFIENDERFLWAPFVFGGLAGTALGYGIANNNQLNNGNYPPIVYGPPYPIYPNYPTYNNTNYYY